MVERTRGFIMKHTQTKLTQQLVILQLKLGG